MGSHHVTPPPSPVPAPAASPARPGPAPLRLPAWGASVTLAASFAPLGGSPPGTLSRNSTSGGELPGEKHCGGQAERTSCSEGTYAQLDGSSRHHPGPGQERHPIQPERPINWRRKCSIGNPAAKENQPKKIHARACSSRQPSYTFGLALVPDLPGSQVNHAPDRSGMPLDRGAFQFRRGRNCS